MNQSTNSLGAELKRQLEEKAILEREIRDLETFPERIREEHEERRWMLPPWGELAERERQDEFETRVSRWELTNKRRELNHSIFLMILLALAMGATLWWVFQFIKSIGV